MESSWILILDTACGGEAESSCEDNASSSHTDDSHHKTGEACSSANGAPAPRNLLHEELWKNHSSTALLQCDVALFPEDSTLSREEFLAAVWRFPRQVLHPCGSENLLLFPPMNVSEYELTISSCQMQPTTFFSESLPVAVALPADYTRVVWPSSSSKQEQVAVTRAQVAMNLAEASETFHQLAASLQEDSSGLSVFDTDDTLFNLDNKTEILFLLQSLKAKIESDVRAVDHILSIMTLVSVIAVLCLLKLIFFGDSPQQRNESSSSRPNPMRLASTAEQSLERPPKTPWLAQPSAVGKGTILFPSPLATPRWTRPDTTAATRRPPPPPNVPSDSPNHTLDTWMRNKEQRRRNRPTDVEPQRLIVPCITPTKEDKEQQPRESETQGDDSSSSNTAVDPPAIDKQSHKSSSKVHEKVKHLEAVKQENPERLARSLWGFGM